MAFGEVVSMQVAYWLFVQNIVDAAIYPTVAADYLLLFFDKDFNKAFITCPIVILMTIMHYFGLDYIVHLNVLILLVTFVPTILFTTLGLLEPQPDVWFSGFNDTNDVDFNSLLSWTIWMASGFSSIGILAARVTNVRTVFLPGLAFLYILMIMVNIFPIAAALDADSDWRNYEDADFARLSKDGVKYGGVWLWVFMILGSVLDNVALYNAQALVSQESLSCFVEHFIGTELELSSDRSCCFTIPSAISVRRLYIIICGALGLLFVQFPYQFLINCEILSYAVTTLLFFVSFYRIRYRGHTEEPGWKIPGGVLGLIVFTGPALLMLSVYFFCLIYFNTDHWLYIINGIMAVIGISLHYGLDRTRRRLGSRFSFNPETTTTLASSFHASFDDFLPVG